MANAKPQDHTKATYAQKVTKEMGHIDWKQEASVIDALIRGMYPSPGTYTYFHGKRIKIHRAFYEHKDTAATPQGNHCFFEGRENRCRCDSWNHILDNGSAGES